jgi:hypothetical protein
MENENTVTSKLVQVAALFLILSMIPSVPILMAQPQPLPRFLPTCDARPLRLLTLSFLLLSFGRLHQFAHMMKPLAVFLQL